MGEKEMNSEQSIIPFNSPVETGLRCLSILNEAFPALSECVNDFETDFVKKIGKVGGGCTMDATGL